MVFNEEGDEEFRKALLEDDNEKEKTQATSEMHLQAIRGSEIAVEKPMSETDRQFKLHLDGFEIGGTETHSKRQEDSALETGIDLKTLEAKRKKKAGIYDLEPVEKLKEKGYNLFLDITEAYGQASQFMDRQNTNNFSMSSQNGSRLQKKIDTSLPVLPRSLLRVDESLLKKGKKSKFFKEFATQHKSTIESQLTVIAEVFGQESDMIKQCKELVFSTSPILRKHRFDTLHSFTPSHQISMEDISPKKAGKWKKKNKKAELSSIQEAHKE
jgi:hypothetical protein